ncbi:MAG: fasciclin domain-containing protein [Desulfuromonadaceae bacterium]|nr:fasciclin domain-containing protein [Desulfuromonadaceae bacterium]
MSDIMETIACSNGVIHIVDNVFVPAHSGWYETTA